MPLEALPFLDKKTQSRFKIRNDWITCTQRVWNVIRKKIGAPLEISRAMKISGLVNFKPSMLGLKKDLPLTPQFYIIGALPKGRWDVYLLHVLILIARKMITLLWLKPFPPTVPQWQERVKKVYLMEKITAHLHLKMDIFRIRWAAISEYLNLSM